MSSSDCITRKHLSFATKETEALCGGSYSLLTGLTHLQRQFLIHSRWFVSPRAAQREVSASGVPSWLASGNLVFSQQSLRLIMWERSPKSWLKVVIQSARSLLWPRAQGAAWCVCVCDLIPFVFSSHNIHRIRYGILRSDPTGLSHTYNLSWEWASSDDRSS